MVWSAWVASLVGFSVGLLRLLEVLLETKKSLVLLWSPVSHVVDSPNGILWVLLIVLIDLLEIFCVDLQSEHVLGLGAV